MWQDRHNIFIAVFHEPTWIQTGAVDIIEWGREMSVWIFVRLIAQTDVFNWISLKAKGKHMSVYVCVCRGEYDSLLTWPFAHKITLTLMDQQENGQQAKHIEHVIKPNSCKENMPFLGRPVADRNTPFGVQKFINLEALNTLKYILDDSIFIKAEVDHDKMHVV
jgi:hypothetical protein